MASPIAGFSGYEGWDPVSAQADFKATGGAGKGGPTGGGSGGINFSFPEIKMSDIGGSAQDLANAQNTKIGNTFNDYASYVKNLEKPLDTYNKLEGEAGIPALRKTATSLSGQVNDLEDTIRRVEGNVSATSRNSLMTEGQRQNLITETKRPLTEDLGWLSQSLGRVLQGIQLGTQDINNKVGLQMKGDDRVGDVYKQAIDVASDQAAREMTGFTSDRQVRLDTLLAKLQSQQQLATAEWQEAKQLEREERGYQQQKEQFAAQASSQTQLTEIGGRTKLINTQTGQVIADLGVSKAPATGGGSDWTKYLGNINSGGNNALMGDSDWELEA